ncbi:hypothetical protein ACP275_10G122500 [Erythranthe tilingii]
MSSKSIFSSGESEKRWVLAMEKNFPHDHILDIDFNTPPCVFTLPKTLSQSKPEAYTPQHLGLGPYHHLRPDLYTTTTQNQKLAAVTEFLGLENLHKFPHVVDALVQSEPLLRSCYDQYIDLDIRTLSWILAIDALFFLHFLKNYSPCDTKMEMDIIMVENQIPAVLLRKIRQVLEPPDAADGNSTLYEEFHFFCQNHSPLELNEYITGDVNQVHLLHHMYYSIVNNVTIQNPFSTYSLQLTDVIGGAHFLADQGLPGAGITAQVLTFMQNIPWDKILGMFKGNSDEQNNPSVEEIDIPSVSRMSRLAGINFAQLASGGIRKIRFDEGEKKFYLPVIKLTSSSEVVLRNLVAYEAASITEPGSTLEFAEYVDLMCGIVDSAKDVDILKMEKIVESELSDEEVARIFNGISKSMKKNENKSNIEEAIDSVNTRYDNVCGVRVRRFAVKYGCALFKFASLVVSVVVLVLLILRAFCSVFGCRSLLGEIFTAQNRNLVLSSY